MWRSVSIVCLLVCSPAFGGEARGVIHVGITITGPRAPANSVAAGSSAEAVASSRGGARAAAVKRPVGSQAQRPQ